MGSEKVPVKGHDKCFCGSRLEVKGDFDPNSESYAFTCGRGHYNLVPLSKMEEKE